MSEYKKVENAKAEITCTIDAEEWAKAQEKAFNKAAKRVEIKGFRKGQAPKHLVEKAINPNSILLDAVEALAQGELDKALKEHEVELIDRPELKIDKLDKNECTLTFVCPVKPDVTLGEYKGLGYNVPEQNVTDEEVDERLKSDLDRKADLELKEDGAVEDGDTAVIDYEGFKDGVAFEGGKDENHDLVIGSGSFIPGFEEQLIGMKPEETKEIEVTFPEDYHAKELAGAKVTFKVTVHEIKKKVLPEADDEFAKSLNYKDVTTLEELKAYYRKQIMDRKTRDAETVATNDLMDKLEQSTTVEIPEVMIENELERSISDYEQRLMAQGLRLEQYLQFLGQTRDDFKEAQRDSARKKVKMDLILEAIAKAENLTPTAEEVEEEYQKWSDLYQMPLEEIKRIVREEDLKADLSLSKALDFVKNN